MTDDARYRDDPEMLGEIEERGRMHMRHADENSDCDARLSGSAADVHHLLRVVEQLKEDARPVTAQLIVGRLPDPECPVCGNPNTDKHYCDACELRPISGRITAVNGCHDGEPEHFHRYCTCGYSWRTDDIPNAQIRCEYELRRRKAAR